MTGDVMPVDGGHLDARGLRHDLGPLARVIRSFGTAPPSTARAA